MLGFNLYQVLYTISLFNPLNNTIFILKMRKVKQGEMRSLVNVIQLVAGRAPVYIQVHLTPKLMLLTAVKLCKQIQSIV